MKESYESCNKTLKGTWEEFKKALGQGRIRRNDIAKAKQFTFIKVLNDIMIYKKNNEELTKTFRELYYFYDFYRGTKLKTKERTLNFERFLPKEEYIKEDNRFSPKGIEYLYLACSYILLNNGHYNLLENTILNEIRAKSGDRVGICKFKVRDLDKKVIDLTLVDKTSIEELNLQVQKSYLNGEEGSIEKYLLKLYFKLLSEEIFKPIETKEGKVEYIPFHFLAFYFESLGFDGIIYKSTVGIGKNMVLFNKEFAEPIRFRIKYI